MKTNTKTEAKTQGADERSPQPAGSVFRAAQDRKGNLREPVLVLSNGDFVHVKLSPQFGGLTCGFGPDQLFFTTGKWAADSGWPKLRWINPPNAEAHWPGAAASDATTATD